MRQFMKDHPWQLEIVSALAVASGIGAVLFYYLTLAEHPFVCEMQSSDKMTMGGIIISRVVMATFFWTLGLRFNHGWVAQEQAKRFNWPSLVWPAGVLLETWIALLLVCVTYEATSPVPRVDMLERMFSLLAAMLLIGIGLTAVLEWRRPFLPHEETPESAPPESDTPGIYVDKEVDWWWVGFALFLAVMCTLAVVGQEGWGYAVVGIVCMVIFASFLFRKVVISPEGVAFHCGPVRKRFPLDDIIECRPLRQELFTWKRLRKTRTFFVTTGRCLELKLRNGMTYRLGMVRPAYACSLIQPMIGNVGCSDTGGEVK
ncbi:MAG: hypothetical protein KBC96_02225 [Armatimonadetes bacterium]|nr:hypothetical protein [Armatimonadota bacterium]